MTNYYVMTIGKHQEDEILVTTSKEQAIQRARDEVYYIKRDRRKKERVEIRVYASPTDEENRWDYDTIEF